MSLLDDAREIERHGPGADAGAACVYCGFLPHQEECVWLSMPKIVAALEALEKYADEEHWRWTHDRDYGDAYTRWNGEERDGMALARAALRSEVTPVTRPTEVADPKGADRAIRTWLRVQDVRRGAMTVDDAVEQTRTEY